MAQYALMVLRPSEHGESGTYASAKASAGTVVDGRGPAPVVPHGPCAERKEHIASPWIAEAAGRDRTPALAARASRACRRRTEVRPVDGA